MYSVRKVCTLFIAILFALQCNTQEAPPKPVPVVLWHGMGDTCCFPFSLGHIKKVIEKAIPGVYVHSLEIGNSITEDYKSGYFTEASVQLDIVCKKIKSDPKLKDGFNAIGFSQGGQFFRALAEVCPQPTIKNLISLGGQHQGVYGVPNCGSLNHASCNYFRKLLNYAAYKEWVQHYLVQASYWHDPLNEDEYREASIFLAKINNEVDINQEYVKNLQMLEKIVFVRFNNDSIVQPVDTEWFGFYKTGQDKETETLQESKIYKEDRLGLKQMDANGQLDFLSVDGNHLEFSEEWFQENIIEKYLKT